MNRIDTFSTRNAAAQLETELARVATICINCQLCQNECGFLQRHGKPKEIAGRYDPSRPECRAMAFECSLCRLCEAVCPVNLNPSELFLAMRRVASEDGHISFRAHAGIKTYEKLGVSKRYTYYALPDGCDTVFFPGCALPGTRPRTTLKLFYTLRRTLPRLGIVLDCCTRPSHDLGRQILFQRWFGEMKAYLTAAGVHRILVACPSCHATFTRYGAPLVTEMVYTVLAGHAPPPKPSVSGVVRVHDACMLRFDAQVHQAVRDLAGRRGLTIEPMPHEGKKAICCGEGGSANMIAPDLAARWVAIRKAEAEGRQLVTYCAGCANRLQQHTPAIHLLDFLFDPAAAVSDTVKISKSPFTYVNRLLLKRHLKKKLTVATARERDGRTLVRT